MEKEKAARLEAAGWRVGDAAQLLGLTPEEDAFIELKLALSAYLQKLRAKHELTQTELAAKLGSSQSRVAKMEAADASVSIDLLVKALLALGASRAQVGHVIARAGA